MAPTVFIDGEHGTTGLQIVNRLKDRNDFEMISIPDAQRKDPEARRSYLRKADFAILCLPDDAAREAVALAGDAGTRFIDASSAHRTADGWVYGFMEMDAGQRQRIASAQFVTNPGCWPQGPIALLRPLIAAGLLPDTMPVSMSGITGYSGGGKAMIADYEGMGQTAPHFLPYGLTLKHKHVPEFKRNAGLAHDPVFMPAVGDFAQGMLTMIPLHLHALGNAPKAADLHAALVAHYDAIPGSLVDVAPLEALERTPLLNAERHNGTSRMTLHVFGNDERGQAVLAAVYDNLGKGASGAAVQNLEIMAGAAA